jgi:hypothetical protein
VNTKQKNKRWKELPDVLSGKVSFRGLRSIIFPIQVQVSFRILHRTRAGVFVLEHLLIDNYAEKSSAFKSSIIPVERRVYGKIFFIKDIFGFIYRPSSRRRRQVR